MTGHIWSSSRYTVPRPDVTWWGMVLFLCNEAALFASLLGTYFFLAATSTPWPQRGIAPPQLAVPLIMTAALLASSGVLIYADRCLARGDRQRYRRGVAGTVFLGLTFLALQGKEYADKLQSLHPSENTYGSIFYTVTGLHGAHVAFGLLCLIWSAARVSASPVTSRPAARNVSLYWHFVDGVWLSVLLSLYLSPRWM